VRSADPLRFNSHLVVDGTLKPLFATQVSFRGLVRNVREEELDLIQFAARKMAEPSARTATMPRSEWEALCRVRKYAESSGLRPPVRRLPLRRLGIVSDGFTTLSKTSRGSHQDGDGLSWFRSKTPSCPGSALLAPSSFKLLWVVAGDSCPSQRAINEVSTPPWSRVTHDPAERLSEGLDSANLPLEDDSECPAAKGEPKSYSIASAKEHIEQLSQRIEIAVNDAFF
jgi:hypothetical protein